MPTTKDELRVQVGKQSAFATGVVPTAALRGVTGFKVIPDQENKVLTDMQLSMAGGDTAVIASNGGSGSMEGWASYEDIPYVLDGLMGEATPVFTTVYTRSYAAPITTAGIVAPRLSSFVHGDSSVGAYQLIGGMPTELTLKMAPKMEVTYTCPLIGSTVAADTLETLTTRTVTPIMAGDVATVFLDPWAGTMGGTALTKCYLRNLELNVKNNRTLRYCIGSLTASDHVTKPWDGTLQMLLEWNSTSKAVIDELVGGTAAKRQVEVNWVNGTKSLKLQFCGVVQGKPEIFDDDDGVVSVRLTLERLYHGTFANWLKFVSVNSVSTLP
jgi:hypothetical protein